MFLCFYKCKVSAFLLFLKSKYASGVSRIKIMSQLQAKGFYEKLGFVVTSEPFMEEGLLHLYMILVL